MLAFPPTEAAAQHRGGGVSRGGGGGSRGGGSWHGGGGQRGYGHAVPRSGYGHVPRGGASYGRHPRAGTGAYGYYGYGHGKYYGHSHGPYYGYYRPYYRPYYGGYYYPYYSPWYGSYYWGSPYYGGPAFSIGLSYGPAYVSGTYAPAPSETLVAPETTPSRSRSPELEGDWGRVRLEVRPEDASVYLDDRFLGTARDMRSLKLTPGRHTIELVRPGFAVERREVEVVEDESVDVLVEMRSARPPA
jgi:hypothetical protein